MRVRRLDRLTTKPCYLNLGSGGALFFFCWVKSITWLISQSHRIIALYSFLASAIYYTSGSRRRGIRTLRILVLGQARLPVASFTDFCKDKRFHSFSQVLTYFFILAFVAHLRNFTISAHFKDFSTKRKSFWSLFAITSKFNLYLLFFLYINIITKIFYIFKFVLLLRQGVEPWLAR